MVVENIFTKGIFADFILPWILIFTLVFAILDKTNVLGQGKKQINAIVAAVIGLLLLAFPTTRDFIVNLIPIMVAMAVILFIFLMLYSFASGDKKGDPLSGGVKIAIGIVIAIVLAITILILTGYWDILLDYSSNSNAGANIIFIIIAAAAVIAVLSGKGEKSKSGGGEE
jgi:hypothetical protein